MTEIHLVFSSTILSPDVTLPSCVDGSQDTEPPAGNTLNRRTGRLKLLSSTCQFSPSDLDKVCQEMMTIYEQLKVGISAGLLCDSSFLSL